MKLNQNHFISATVALTIVLAYFAGQISGSSLQIFATKMMNGSLVLGVPSVFIHFLRGTSYDVYEEIFDNKNVAAAILLGFAWLAYAIASTVVS